MTRNGRPGSVCALQTICRYAQVLTRYTEASACRSPTMGTATRNLDRLGLHGPRRPVSRATGIVTRNERISAVPLMAGMSRGPVTGTVTRNQAREQRGRLAQQVSVPSMRTVTRNSEFIAAAVEAHMVSVPGNGDGDLQRVVAPPAEVRYGSVGPLAMGAVVRNIHEDGKAVARAEGSASGSGGRD